MADTPLPTTKPAEKAPKPVEPNRTVNTRAPESLWALRRPLPRRLEPLFTFALPVIVAALWLGLTWGAHPVIGAQFLPSPLRTLKALGELFFLGQCDSPTHCSIWQSYLLRCIAASTLRILLSFTLAAALALPLGIAMGSYEPINRLFEPIMAPLRYLPISAFIPLFILWFGIDEPEKISFLFLGVFVYLLPVVVSSIRAVPDELVQTALTLGATRAQVVRTVLLPAAMPDIFDSFRVMNAISWTYLILAEFVNTPTGLGDMIFFAGNHSMPGRVFVGLVVVGVIGLATDGGIRGLSRVMFPWREVAQ